MLTKQEKAKKIKEWMSTAQLDSEVVGETIGESHSNITVQLLLSASSKLIRIARQDEEEDDRDNLKFFNVLGMEDFVKENIENDAGKIQKKFLQKAKQKKNLSFLNNGFFSPQIRSVSVGNSLSQLPDQENPITWVDTSEIITKRGQGGIGSPSAAPEEARYMHPSYFGSLSPVRQVESLDVGLVYRATQNTLKTKDGKLLLRARDNKDGKEKWVDHKTLLNSVVEIPEY